MCYQLDKAHPRSHPRGFWEHSVRQYIQTVDPAPGSVPPAVPLVIVAICATTILYLLWRPPEYTSTVFRAVLEQRLPKHSDMEWGSTGDENEQVSQIW